ncbi:MAG: thioredoxin [Bacteroidetes bacterium HGW-Bacteroidetes-21]|nr:MAG: thioredoxin [Bacteroidetes bacterium HGW-Bacteroidetes-21]
MVDDHKSIVTLTAANFQAKTKNKIVLIDFWAAWCAPCRMMSPILNSVAADLKGNQQIGKVNIEQHQALAQKYKVRSIPTMIILKNGVEVTRFSGVKSREFLLQQLAKVSY